MLGIDTRSEYSQAQRQPTCTAGATLPERLCSAELPTGTVTFLLTDIQGSTRLWDTHPREMRLATVQHDHLIESTVARHAGTVVRPRGEGDSRFAVFRRASDAIAAAVDIQFGLAHENWDLPEPLRVHLGLHTGEADVREGDYYGSAVNRCARLRTLAHGGQILLSGATFDVVQDAPDGWPAGTTPRPLGEHRLAGLSRPERIFELVVDGLPSAFPLLAVASEPPTNLPGEVTTFIGRERELALLEHRLLDSKVRLITLVGPGGVGKTRLAQQVARNVIGAFSDGIYFVSLAAITGPHLVASAIAQTLGILDGSNKPVVETLVARLREQELLLVLDNFEQVRIAGPTVATLLKACSRLKVLATSRSLLHLTGEHRLEVAPLGVPPANVAPSVAERAESVRLFIDRAQAADAEFSHTPRNSAAVQSICRTLEGLPLAIELVAARVRDFPPGALAAHLERHRLALLTGGPSDAPQRHQTLRAAIGWSHALLTPEEQTLFRQLAVFAGGCAPETAQMVCRLTGDAFQVESALGGLTEKSLLRVERWEEAEPRFRMLETIREFALEQLDASEDAYPTRERHAHVFRDLLEAAARHRNGPDEGLWLQRLASDLDNLRAAWRWAIDQAQSELALRMADAALPFLTIYGYSQEASRWLTEVLDLAAEESRPLRARVALGAGWLNHQMGKLPAAEQFFREAIAHGHAAGDRMTTCTALGGLAFVRDERGDFAEAVHFAREGLAIARELSDTSQIARSLTRLAEILALNADAAPASEAAEQAITLAESVHDTFSLAAALDVLGLAKRLEGRATEAAELLDRAVKLHEAHAYKANAAEALLRYADALLLQGNIDEAAARCVEALKFAQDAGNQRRVATSIRVAASVAMARGDAPRALELSAAAKNLYASLGYQLTRVEEADLLAVQTRAEVASPGSDTPIRCNPDGSFDIETVVTQLLSSGI